MCCEHCHGSSVHWQAVRALSSAACVERGVYSCAPCAPLERATGVGSVCAPHATSRLQRCGKCVPSGDSRDWHCSLRKDRQQCHHSTYFATFWSGSPHQVVRARASPAAGSFPHLRSLWCLYTPAVQVEWTVRLSERWSHARRLACQTTSRAQKRRKVQCSRATATNVWRNGVVFDILKRPKDDGVRILEQGWWTSAECDVKSWHIHFGVAGDVLLSPCWKPLRCREQRLHDQTKHYSADALHFWTGITWWTWSAMSESLLLEPVVSFFECEQSRALFYD